MVVSWAKTVRERFSLEREVESYLTLYEELAAGSRSTRSAMRA
jgi:hypothetical protein